MEKEFKIGQILEVKTSTGIHFERVIQTENEVLTETIQETQDEDICTQGLTSNWEYRIVPDVEIILKLKKYNECF